MQINPWHGGGSMIWSSSSGYRLNAWAGAEILMRYSQHLD